MRTPTIHKGIHVETALLPMKFKCMLNKQGVTIHVIREVIIIFLDYSVTAYITRVVKKVVSIGNMDKNGRLIIVLVLLFDFILKLKRVNLYKINDKEDDHICREL